MSQVLQKLRKWGKMTTETARKVRRGLTFYEKICYQCVAPAIAFLEDKIVVAAANPNSNYFRRAQWAIEEQNRFCQMRLLN